MLKQSPQQPNPTEPTGNQPLSNPQYYDPNLPPSGYYPPGPPEKLELLYSWKAPERPFKKRSREWYTTAGSIIFLLCVILIFIKEWLLITVLMALGFYLYVSTNVKPEEVENYIYNHYIGIGKAQYPWEVLGRFWFDKKYDEEILYIENFNGFPARLSLLVGKAKKQEIVSILEQYLLQEKPEKTQMELAGEWLQRKVPLETSSQPQTQSSSSKKPKSSSSPKK